MGVLPSLRLRSVVGRSSSCYFERIQKKTKGKYAFPCKVGGWSTPIFHFSCTAGWSCRLWRHSHGELAVQREEQVCPHTGLCPVLWQWILCSIHHGQASASEEVNKCVAYCGVI